MTLESHCALTSSCFEPILRGCLLRRPHAASLAWLWNRAISAPRMPELSDVRHWPVPDPGEDRQDPPAFHLWLHIQSGRRDGRKPSPAFGSRKIAHVATRHPDRFPCSRYVPAPLMRPTRSLGPNLRVALKFAPVPPAAISCWQHASARRRDQPCKAFEDRVGHPAHWRVDVRHGCLS
jgi:hypothetical protein